MIDLSELKQIKDNVVSELQAASEGKPSSYPFIKYKLPSGQQQYADPFQILSIGGTNYQNAVVKKEGTHTNILTIDYGEAPPFKTASDFLGFISGILKPDVTQIALNFAYPMHSMIRNERMDGILQNGSKENVFEGLIGKPIGQSIEEYIAAHAARSVHVSVTNDTISLLLSGLERMPWNTIAAGIIGTGLNGAIFLDENTAVNLEAANFNKFTPTLAGKIIDADSIQPGKALFEKEISGAYLYKHFNIGLKQQGIAGELLTSTKQLDAVAMSSDEKQAGLAKETLVRSARFAAAQIAGVMEFSKRDLTFIMQGSLYWKGYMYRDTLADTVKQLTDTFRADYLQIPHSDIVGASKLIA